MTFPNLREIAYKHDFELMTVQTRAAKQNQHIYLFIAHKTYKP